VSSNSASIDSSDLVYLAGHHLTIKYGWTTLIACLLMIVGCQAEHDEHEEDSHFPPHWPKSFLEAADRLNQISTNPANTQPLAENIEQELVDLIDWLPELIADSDLSKEEFDKVDSWAYPLANELKQSIKAGTKVGDLLKNETLLKGLSDLTELANHTKRRQAEAKAREEQEEAEAKRIAGENLPAAPPNPEGN
jgi:hypothetical protein